MLCMVMSRVCSQLPILRQNPQPPSVSCHVRCNELFRACQYKTTLLAHPRALDAELRGVVKAKDVRFEADRLGFVLEAQGSAQQLYFEQGQSRIQNALKQAERSAFELFQRQLQNDQAHFRSSLGSTYMCGVYFIVS